MNNTHYHEFKAGAGPRTCSVLVGTEPCLLSPESEFHRHTFLKDVLPREFMTSEFENSLARRYAEEKVLVQHDWWELKNGYVVGWNENPSRGWSFPVEKSSDFVEASRKYAEGDRSLEGWAGIILSKGGKINA